MDDLQNTDDRPDSYRVTADELRQFIERFERLESEKRDIADQQKEVMAEAKARGYDTKVMRKVIALQQARARRHRRGRGGAGDVQGSARHALSAEGTHGVRSVTPGNSATTSMSAS
jgi:uncharacterized protein (UPF0335 family)